MDAACVYLETPGGRRLPFARRHGIDAVSRALPYVGASLEFAGAEDGAVPSLRVPLEYCCGAEEWDRVCALLLGDGGGGSSGGDGGGNGAAPLDARCCCAAFALELCAFSHTDESYARVADAVAAILGSGYATVLDAYRRRHAHDPDDHDCGEPAAIRDVLTLWRVCDREGIDASPLLRDETLSDAHVRLNDAVQARFLRGGYGDRDDGGGDRDDGGGDEKALCLSFFRAWRALVHRHPPRWRLAMLAPAATSDAAPEARRVAAGVCPVLAAGVRAEFSRWLCAHAGPFSSLVETIAPPPPPPPKVWCDAYTGGAVLCVPLLCGPGDGDDYDDETRERGVDLFVYGPREDARTWAYREAVAAAWRCAGRTGANVYGVVETGSATVYAEDCPVYARVVLSDARSPLDVPERSDADAARCFVDRDGTPLVTPDCLHAFRTRVLLRVSRDTDGSDDPQPSEPGRPDRKDGARGRGGGTATADGVSGELRDAVVRWLEGSVRLRRRLMPSSRLTPVQNVSLLDLAHDATHRVTHHLSEAIAFLSAVRLSLDGDNHQDGRDAAPPADPEAVPFVLDRKGDAGRASGFYTMRLPGGPHRGPVSYAFTARCAVCRLSERPELGASPRIVCTLDDGRHASLMARLREFDRRALDALLAADDPARGIHTRLIAQDTYRSVLHGTEEMYYERRYVSGALDEHTRIVDASAQCLLGQLDTLRGRTFRADVRFVIDVLYVARSYPAAGCMCTPSLVVVHPPLPSVDWTRDAFACLAE